MRTVLLASLKHNRRRYVASALAVVLGVAFIVATNGLAGALRDGMTKDVALPYRGTDVVVTLDGTEEDQRAFLAEAAREGVVVTPQYSDWLTVDHAGNPVDLAVRSVAADPSMQWQEVVEGRMAERDGEALLGEKRSIESGIEIGDTITLPQVAPRDGADPVTVTIVGVVADTTLGFADLFIRPADGEAAGLAPWTVHVGGDTTWLEADDHSSLTRVDVAQQIDDDQKMITQGVDVIAMLVSLFAAIALMVAVLVITNTFAILFAQRARDFALLRCVGVTAKQLRRSVRVEALVLGVVASAIGVALGVGLAHGISALAGIWVSALGTATFSLAWIVGAMLIGVAVTLAAAWLPTRAVTRISPLAALRPTGGVDAKSRAGVLRLVLGTVVALAGSAVLAWTVLQVDVADGASTSTLLTLMLLGGSVAFVGVLLLGPWIVTGLVRALGRVATRPGAAGAVTRLATANSVRNPRRTATTAASLMVGVTLTTAVLAGLNSVRVTLNTEMEGSYPLDVVAVAAQIDRDLSGASGRDLVAAMTGQSEIEDAVLVDGALVTLGENQIRALAVTGDESPLRNHDDQFGTADVLVGGDTYVALTDQDPTYEGDGVTTTLSGPNGDVEVSVRLNDAYGAETAAIRPDVLAKVAVPSPSAVFALADDDAEITDVQNAVSRAGVEAGVVLDQGGGHADRTYFDSQFSVIAAAVVGLLSIAVLIALIGIGNTLGLSVLERTRENSLLRAMGYTKAQMRRTLAWEGALLALVATVMGVAIGLTFAWVGLQVLLADIPVGSEFSVPVVQVIIIVVVALVAGVLASVLPSRKAARVSPAAGLALQ